MKRARDNPVIAIRIFHQQMTLIYLLNFALYFFDTNFITQTFKYKDKLVVIYLIFIQQIKGF